MLRSSPILRECSHCTSRRTQEDESFLHHYHLRCLPHFSSLLLDNRRPRRRYDYELARGLKERSRNASSECLIKERVERMLSSRFAVSFGLGVESKQLLQQQLIVHLLELNSLIAFVLEWQYDCFPLRYRRMNCYPRQVMYLLDSSVWTTCKIYLWNLQLHALRLNGWILVSWGDYY